MGLLSAVARRAAGASCCRSSGFRASLCAVLLALGVMSNAQGAAPTEYQVKAVFLFNFAQFVEWPPAAFADASAPLVIGVLGEDPFGPYLDEVVRGEAVAGRSLAVRRYHGIDELSGCHILFISSSETARLAQILANLGGRPILTVGDTEGYAARGVMIRFVRAQNRIRMKVNADAATAAGLTISSKLLRPAEIVRTDRE